MSKDLELFKEKDFPEKKMPIDEVSLILGVSTEAVKKWVREMFPGSIRNGIKTMLSETEITAIKLKMRPTTKVVAAKTDLEKALIIQQAAMFQQEMIDRLTTENKQLSIDNKEMKPKAEFFDRVTNSTDTVDMAAVSQLLDIPGIGRNKLYNILREKKILKKSPYNLKNTPYQEYIDRGYFKVIETETSGGIKLKTLVFQKGLDYIRKIID